MTMFCIVRTDSSVERFCQRIHEPMVNKPAAKGTMDLGGYFYWDFPDGRSGGNIAGMARLTTVKHLLECQQARVWSWAILCCILLFVVGVRFRLRDMPLERDEGEFAYAGQLFLRGIAPGNFAYTMKLPGTHLTYAILMLVFGQTCAGVHVGFLMVNCATIVNPTWTPAHVWPN